MKVVKRILISILCLPVVLILLFIVYEIIGMVVNHTATAMQTDKLEKVICEEISDAEILDTYSETGNTSGTGNHVDMLSVICFRTNYDIGTVADKLKQFDVAEDEYDFWIETMESVEKAHQEDSYRYGFCDELEIPEDLSGCYLVYKNDSAPFSDNIEGH